MQNNGTWVQREQVQEEMGGVKGGGGQICRHQYSLGESLLPLPASLVW